MHSSKVLLDERISCEPHEHGLMSPVAGVGRVRQMLVSEAVSRGPFGEIFQGGGEAGYGDGPDVALGLQQVRDDLGFLRADQRDGFLQADGGAEPGREHVVAAMPPAGIAGIAPVPRTFRSRRHR